MKKHLFAVLMIFTFIACDNDSEEEQIKFSTVGLITEIEISDIEGNYPSELTDLTFVARYHVPAASDGTINPSDDENARIMLSVPFNKEGTKLLLPENPSPALLLNITKDIPKGFNISDPQANTISFTEIAYYSENHRNKIVGNFILKRNIEDAYYTVHYIYCDRTVKITGTSKDWWDFDTTYNVDLKEGWNMVVEKHDNGVTNRIVTFTNLLPEGMKWEYGMWIGRR